MCTDLEEFSVVVLYFPSRAEDGKLTDELMWESHRETDRMNCVSLALVVCAGWTQTNKNINMRPERG